MLHGARRRNDRERDLEKILLQTAHIPAGGAQFSSRIVHVGYIEHVREHKARGIQGYRHARWHITAYTAAAGSQQAMEEKAWEPQPSFKQRVPVLSSSLHPLLFSKKQQCDVCVCPSSLFFPSLYIEVGR